MEYRHRVRINVAQSGGETQGVLASGSRRVPARLMRLLFGQYSEVLVLAPGKSVRSVEIHEAPQGDHDDRG